MVTGVKEGTLPLAAQNNTEKNFNDIRPGRCINVEEISFGLCHLSADSQYSQYVQLRAS
jgi:hypothetical protein